MWSLKYILKLPVYIIQIPRSVKVKDHFSYLRPAARGRKGVVEKWRVIVMKMTSAPKALFVGITIANGTKKSCLKNLDSFQNWQSGEYPIAVNVIAD